MELNFTTKFGWEDRVYYIYRITTFKKVTCPNCGGKVCGQSNRCFECCGLGYIEKDEMTYIVSELCTISFFHISSHPDSKPRITYILKPVSSDTRMFDEQFVFATKEEAQERCDFLNKLNEE